MRTQRSMVYDNKYFLIDDVMVGYMDKSSTHVSIAKMVCHAELHGTDGPSII